MFDTIYKNTVTYLEIIQNAMYVKLNLVRYYNTQLTRVQTFGGSFYQPMFFQYPNETLAYGYQERNVMLGNALKLGYMASATGIDTT